MEYITALSDAVGGWTWWIVATFLLLLELLVPGVYFLWLGVAAAIVALSTIFIDWSWQWELVSFTTLSIVTIMIARMVVSRRPIETDHPMLNRRADALIGRSFVLEDPIKSERGRVKVDDSMWRVSGPDCPAGTKVKVMTTVDGVLTVEPAASDTTPE